MAKSKKDFSTKDRIEHAVFGTGTIAEANEKYTTIDFDEEGTRKFLTSMVKLKHTDTPAPAKRVRKKKTTAKKATAKKATAKKATAKKVTAKKATAKKATAKKATAKKATKKAAETTDG